MVENNWSMNNRIWKDLIIQQLGEHVIIVDRIGQQKSWFHMLEVKLRRISGSTNDLPEFATQQEGEASDENGCPAWCLR